MARRAARPAMSWRALLAAACLRGATAVAQGAVALDNYTFDKMLDHPGWGWLVKFDKAHAHGDKEKAFKEVAKLSSTVPNFFVGEVAVQEYGEKANIALRERFGFSKDDLPGYVLFKYSRKPGDNKGEKYTGEIQDDLITLWLRGHGVKLVPPDTIAELDELAKKFIESSFAENHLTRARSLAAGEFKRDKKAPVYVKIMEKLKAAGDASYLETEAKRVGRVLASGQNTPAKVSELKEKLKILLAIMEKDPVDLAGGLEIVFLTGAGSEKTLLFERKPLGMHFEQNLPMKVKKAQDYAKELGVEVGWEVKTIGGVEIKGAKEMKFAEATEVLKKKVALIKG